ncbi:hypothetical protein AVEN_45327-1 [Araneus ventricosus]|uniref:Uncharacterized protein n=1 Tax=Araneus ventricosus TaxID=182803 RepID=A0A4Y2ICB2_ARAVE|nr:hypothetical protein AVEN_45327-1 [Araneus ventricosus]
MTPFLQSIKYRSVELLGDRVASRHKLFVVDSLATKKANQHAFDRRLAHPCFFGLSEFGVCHSWHTPVAHSFGVVLKHQSRATRGSFSIHSKKSRHSVILNCDRTEQYRTMKIVAYQLKAIPVFAFQHCYKEWQNRLQRCVAAQAGLL